MVLGLFFLLPFFRYPVFLTHSQVARSLSGVGRFFGYVFGKFWGLEEKRLVERCRMFSVFWWKTAVILPTCFNGHL